VTAMTTIASLGLGRMGAPMAGRLLAASHEVHVWDRTPDRAAALAQAAALALADVPDQSADLAVLVTKE
jgi:3-hydroxyisobutyrate dehydrogenase